MTPSDFPKPALRCSKCSCEWSRTVAATCPLCGASALPADPRPTLPAPAHHESRVIITADVLAGAVCRLVQAGTLDARSEVGDALLSYASTRHGDERPIDAVRETAEAIKLGANRLPASAVALPAEPDEERTRDWIEDENHENGEYLNRCVHCKNLFVGHKRRVTCRLCAEPRPAPYRGAPLGELVPPLSDLQKASAEISAAAVSDPEDEKADLAASYQWTITNLRRELAAARAELESVLDLWKLTWNADWLESRLAVARASQEGAK